MKSVMKHSFSQVPHVGIPRSTFDRTHAHKTTFDSGFLVPIFVDEVLPGDTFNMRAAYFGRLATPIVPVMDNMFLKTYYFFVPNRLLWDNWQKFCGEQINPGDSTDYLVPKITTPAGGWPVGSLSDYFGLPTGVPNVEQIALYHRAYNLIYNEWFRDENLIDSVEVPTDDGPDAPEQYSLLRRCKSHDYFTSALPWPQKGAAVELNLGGYADLVADPNFSGLEFSAGNDGWKLGLVPTPSDGGGATIQRKFLSGFREIGAPIGFEVPSGTTQSEDPGYVTPEDESIVSPVKFSGGIGYRADLSSATAFTINALRQSFQIQRMLERDARGGTRYTEILRSHFRVVSPDARLQRPEYLGGSTTRINVSPVQQTSSSDSTSPQGNLAAFGLAADNARGFSRSFVEHGVIIGLVTITADLTYQQGLPRMFSRSTRYDYYWPSLAHLGEQAILNKEIYAQGTSVDNDVFGYQERFAEYRYYPSKITGKFRSTDPQSLDFWHLSQKFDSLPKLSKEFIEDFPPIERVIAVQDEPQFILDCYFSLRCHRPMPVYSVPGLIDHF